MKRRRFITALGAVASASGLAVGSGAFNFANVERSVSIAVADDDSAFLKLTERGSGMRSAVDGGILKINIPGYEESDYPTGNPTDPAGVGTDSVYRFARDAGGDEAGLFGVTNQGTHPIKVYSTQPSTAGVPSITIFDVESEELLTEDSPSAALGIGEQLLCGIEVDTHGVEPRSEEYEVSVVINADATDN